MTRRTRTALVLAPAVALFTFAVLRSAWVTEDAYIAFRTVDNFVHGLGLRWNIDERVQTYTCPLWVLLYSVFYFLTREPYYTAIVLCVACSVAAVGLVAWIGRRTPAMAVLAVIVLTCSKAFVDYSTSGLENPLTHLLLAGFAIVYFGDAPAAPGRRLFVLSLLAALVGVNRMDAILLVLPALAYARWTQPDRRRALLPAAAGFVPLIAWLLFAFWYYGFPFPNTAYAKLKTGIGTVDLVRQGVHYFRNSRRNDPLTLAVIGGTLLLTAGAWLYGLRSRWRSSLRAWHDATAVTALAGGIVFYLAYTLKIGGDYMSGRFFAAPLLLAAIVLAAFDRRQIEGPRPMVACLLPALASVAVLCVAIARPNSPLRAGRHYGVYAPWEALVDQHQISDERAVFFADLGLFHAADIPADRSWAGRWRRGGEAQVAHRPAGNVALVSTAGVWCYYGPRDLHYLDVYALCDPLLAHLPPPFDPRWRIGHLRRSLPLGYFETLVTGENQIADPKLAVYYDKLRFVSRGPLFSLSRLREAVKLNLGRYESLIDYDYYRRPVFLPENSPNWSAEKGWAGIVLPPNSPVPASRPTSPPGSRP